MNSNKISHENRKSDADEPPMRPIEAEATVVLPMRWIRLFPRHLRYIFDASAMRPPARPIKD